MKQFVDIFGELIPCQNQRTPEPYKPCVKEEGKPEESKKDKNNKKKLINYKNNKKSLFKFYYI